ncbi:MAG: phosphatase PAP2 family protein [Candidatus Micrarchaeia archaeon]
MQLLNITQINDFAFKIADSVKSTAMNNIMQILGASFLLVIPVLVLYLAIKRDKNVFALAVAGALLYIISDTIKLIVREPRPCTVPQLSWINAPSCESSFSFPSNHASVLTGLVFFTNKYKYLKIAYIVWLVFVLFGRIYLGLHYFTDVLAGIALSIIISYAVYVKRDKIYAFGLRLLPFLKRFFGG